ncbi:MAG: hypothetical protein IJ445_06965 [Clostridia bacterium]|nr:hypothetical protein [Clostridia bacterium]
MNDFEKIKNLMRCFPRSYINQEGEFIAHEYANEYFILRNCETELDIKCKVLEWFSRSYKQRIYKTPIKNLNYQEFMRNGINNYLGTNFTKDDLCMIYSYLGNACNHEKTIQFVNSGYDMQILKR